MGTKLYLFEKLAFFFSPVLFKSFSDFFSGTFFHANYFSIFSMVRFFYGKKYDQSCRGRRSRRQVSVAVADFGRRLLLILSRSPKSATNISRGRRLWPPVVLKFVAVAEVGDKKLSRSPTSAAGYFFVCRGRRSRRQKICRGRRLRPPVIFQFVAVAEVGDKILSRSPTSVSIGAVQGSPGYG